MQEVVARAQHLDLPYDILQKARKELEQLEDRLEKVNKFVLCDYYLSLLMWVKQWIATHIWVATLSTLGRKNFERRSTQLF